MNPDNEWQARAIDSQVSGSELTGTPVLAPRNLATAAASFAASIIKFAASGFTTVDEPLHQFRMSQCEPCEYRKEAQCHLCRCFIDKKAWLPHEDCPIGRWPT